MEMLIRDRFNNGQKTLWLFSRNFNQVILAEKLLLQLLLFGGVGGAY
jgi:hypothetical protein